MKKNALGFIALLVAVFAISCKKETTKTGPSPENRKKMSATYGYSDFPTNNSGMLVFRDAAHFDKYIDFLDMATDAIAPEDETQDEHSVLQDVENGLGFNSLRNVTHAAYEVQDAKGWPSIDAIPDEHFIADPVMRSVLNNSLEVQIGNEIKHYVNKDIVVMIDASDTRLLGQYRNLTPVATLDDIRFIDPFLTGSAIEYRDEHGFPIVFGKGTVPKPTGTDFVVPPAVKFPDKCNNPKLAEFFGLALRNASGFLQGYCLVQYGDGTQETKNTVLTASGWKVPNFQHTYPSPGQYTVTIKGYFQGGGLIEIRSQTVTVTAGGCAITYKSTDWQYGYISSTVAWGGKLEMEKIGNNPGKGRLVAYTKLVRQNSDGSWSGFKGKIYTALDCYAKTTDGNCTNVDHLVGNGYDNKKKDNKVHRTGLGQFAWQTATSQHTYIDDNGEHTTWIQMNSCP